MAHDKALEEASGAAPAWNEARVLAESARWVWAPATARRVTAPGIEVALREDAPGRPTATVLRAEPNGRDATTLLHDVLEVIRPAVAGETGDTAAATLTWRVSPIPDPPGLDTALLAAGGEVAGVDEIAAYDLTTGPPDIEVPDGVEVRPVRARDDLVAFSNVSCAVWGHNAPDPEALDRELAEPGGPLGCFLATLNGTPAGTAGVTHAGPVARMWGAAVLPERRGRGLYRGLLAARIGHAIDRGATLALVHAMVETSAPILRRIGFTVHGLSRRFKIAVR